MDERNKQIDILENANVKTALLSLGIPPMVGMLVSALYNLVDAFWVGRLGMLQTAAVSVVYPLSMVGMGVGMLFGSGANSCIARYLGKKDFENVKVYSSTAILSGVGMISFLAAGMLLFLTPLIRILGATDSFSYAKEYGAVFVVGLIFNVFNMIMNNICTAQGNTRIGMSAMLVGGFINFLLDPIFIFLFDWGVCGAAIATLVSNIISAILYVIYLSRGQSYITFSLRYFRFAVGVYKEIFKIGLPVCAFQILAGCAVGLTNNVAGAFGEAAKAAIGIVNRIMSLETNMLYGFFKGYFPLVGYNYGAGNMKRVKQSTKVAIVWSTTVNAVLGVLCILFAKQFVYLFNQDSAEVLTIGSTMLRVNALAYMMAGVQVVIGNYFLALGKAKQGGILSMSRQGFSLYRFF